MVAHDLKHFGEEGASDFSQCICLMKSSNGTIHRLQHMVEGVYELRPVVKLKKVSAENPTETE